MDYTDFSIQIATVNVLANFVPVSNVQPSTRYRQRGSV